MGLVDAPDPQEAERGLEHCRMVQFLISLSQMVHYKYDQLLEVVELKYLNVCALGTPLLLIKQNSMVVFILFGELVADIFSKDFVKQILR